MHYFGKKNTNFYLKKNYFLKNILKKKKKNLAISQSSKALISGFLNLSVP